MMLTICLFLMLVCVSAAGRPRRNDETLFLSPEMRDTFRAFILTGTDLAEDRVTPWIPVQGQDALPRFRRACPSSLYMRYNPNRIPALTFERHCAQQQCSLHHDSTEIFTGLNSPPQDTEATATSTCRPINYYRWVKVLTRRANGRRKVQHRLLELPVGCSCTAEPQERE